MEVRDGGRATIRSSEAAGNSRSFCAQPGASELRVQGSVAAHNNLSGIRAAGGMARVAPCLVTGNGIGLDNQAGTIESLGTSLVQGNATNASGTITAAGGR